MNLSCKMFKINVIVKFFWWMQNCNTSIQPFMRLFTYATTDEHELVTTEISKTLPCQIFYDPIDWQKVFNNTSYKID